MHAFSTPRLTRAAIGLAAVSALAIAPMAAQAANTPATGTDAVGTLGAGFLTFSVPTLGRFDTTLNGIAQVINTTVGPWNITDARGTHAGYVMTVAASQAADTASTPDTLPVGAITMIPTQATATAGNVGPTAPVTGGGLLGQSTPTALQLSGSGSVIDNASAVSGNAGVGSWDFTDDASVLNGHTPVTSLAVAIPVTTVPGTYTSTLTFTAGTAVN